MKRILMLVPIGTNVGLTTVSIGLIQKMHDENCNIIFFKPIFNVIDNNCKLDHTTRILKKMSSVLCLKPVRVDNINHFLIERKKQNIIKDILLEIDRNKKYDSVLCLEGVCLKTSTFLSNIINYEIARAINAEIIFICSIRRNDIVDIKNTIEVIKTYFINKKNINVKGIIINEFQIVRFELFYNYLNYLNISNTRKKEQKIKVSTCVDKNMLYKYYNMPILGYIPWNAKLIEPTLEEISLYFRAHVINNYGLSALFVRSIVIYDKNNFFKYDNSFFVRTVLLFSCNENIYDLEKMCQNIKKYSSIIAVLITDSNEFSIRFIKSCFSIKKAYFPILLVKKNMLQTVLLLRQFNFKISTKNINKFNVVRKYVSIHLDNSLKTCFKNKYMYEYPVCSSVFIYNLLNLAKKNKKKILLPEGNELRIIQAASICSIQKIARCVLLGNPTNIKNIAKLNNVKLESSVEILNPILIRNNYIKRLVQLRSHYGITVEDAKKMIENNAILSTLILESNEVDGLVSGSVNTTSDTILPALQLIKTSQFSSLISSVFFMLLPDRVLLYADCAINPNPNADQLAEIAIQSADTAISFGVLPKIAMLSYATGISGSGEKVDKVKKATDIVRNKCPHLIIEGPIQYDAAIDSIVSQLKCHNSTLGGQATVFIFPDLDSGNITYKAVQRSANIISIGPILQGIKKPVNDLSRGASVQDIVYTIAATVVQSEQ
ncbi:MAG: phosphate acetyltransferase [Buchnera aphidicola (Meitanaphis elongallis)]